MPKGIKPLSYAEQIAVLEQADPNTRIRWGLECPEIGKIERRVPLRCEHIELDVFSGTTSIDGAFYKVSLTIKCGTQTRVGGDCDRDEQGREDWATLNSVGPGDIMLTKRPNTEITGNPLSSFSTYIVFCNNGKSERLEYKGKTLIEAQRHLNTCLFGNRNHPVEVERLVVGSGVLRLPEGVKFHVRELVLGHISLEYLDNLQTILTPESLPLEYVKIRYSNTNAKECDHPMVRSAKTLDLYDTGSNDFLEFLKSIRNPTIIHKGALANFMDHISLIEDWKNHPREVGSSITFERLGDVYVKSLSDGVMQNYKCTMKKRHRVFKYPGSNRIRISNYPDINEKGDVILPINQNLELHFTAGKHRAAPFQEGLSFFKMEVVPAGSR